jgi:uncharacterized membrane protein
MTAVVVFENPLGWQLGLPAVALLLGCGVRALGRRGLAGVTVALLTALRAVPLLLLALLAARPVWVTKNQPFPAERPVAVLLDRSASMSLEEGGKTRYQQALDFTREHLLPALKSAGLPTHGWLFAEAAEPADGEKLAAASPNGKRTDLGRAIARALTDTLNPPLAVIALTDGIVNESTDNARAMARLAEARAPFIGLAFGSDLGVRTLTLHQVEAPPVAAPNTMFNVSAQLEAMNTDELPPFDLALLRDGKMLQKKTIQAGRGSRCWLESFPVTEQEQGVHTYAAQFVPPAVPGLKCVNTMAAAAVRIINEKELRILYVQGALTWDYKFIGLALRNDPALKLTGLTRTSQQSLFRQNVESAGELVQGFPTTLAELALFRVVVLSNLKPIDLTPAQQELLARFCSELGGGVLVIGGVTTFDPAWQGSRLEQVLPVTFPAARSALWPDRPFRVSLTEAALEHPVFQVADNRPAREVWAQLPTFTQYGRVETAKPGAQTLMVHPDEQGPKGARILMAAQRYGAGRSAVLCIQNFWRWRLAKESEPQQFDRFWRQLFRFLGEAGRQEVTIHLAEQNLHPQMDVRLVLERAVSASSGPATNQPLWLRVELDHKQTVREQTLELPPGRSAEVSFRAEDAGLYAVTVLDASKHPLATRAIELRDVNLEFQNTRRELETLRQWASLSEGLALKVEDCRDTAGLVKQIKANVEQRQREHVQREPLGLNAWFLSAIVACLAAEWVLRKRWDLP